MEKALALNPLELRARKAAGLKGFGLLYLGDEFCERLVPDAAAFRRASGRFSGRTVLVTPLMTDDGIDAVERVIRSCSSPRKPLEIVINDLGLLHLVRESWADRVSVTLGRIFGHRLKVMPKNFTADFLREHGVKRIEVDDPSMPSRFEKFRGMKLSFHSTMRYLSATRFCPWERHWPGACSFSCRGRIRRIGHPRLPDTLILKGSSYGVPGTQAPDHRMIDRLVTETLPRREAK